MATYGLTWLQLINRVLVRLREQTVAANNTTEYSTQIGQLLNQVKNEIESAWRWNTLRDTYDVTTADGTAGYVFTGAGPNAVILSGWDNTNGRELLRPSSNREFDQLFFGTTTVQRGMPVKFLPAGTDLNHDLKVDIWPIPDGVYSLKFNLYVPQDDLAADADVPRVPQDVLLEETIARAIAERGDEGGGQVPPPGVFIRADLLATAIARDAGRDEYETDWYTE